MLLIKWKNSAMNCEAYSSFEGVSSDHRIVTAKIRLSLRKNAKRTATTKHYDWALLNNRDIRDKYVLELRNRFETLQEKTKKSTPNDEYENFDNVHLEAATKCIPTWCSRYRRRKWTRRHEFKSWPRLIAFHIALIPWGRYESNYSPSCLVRQLV